jgi:hypothetical protein
VIRGTCRLADAPPVGHRLEPAGVLPHDLAMQLLTFRRIAHRIAAEDREARLVASRRDASSVDGTDDAWRSLATYRSGVGRVAVGPTTSIAPFLLRSRGAGA